VQSEAFTFWSLDPGDVISSYTEGSCAQSSFFGWSYSTNLDFIWLSFKVQVASNEGFNV